MSNEEYQRLLRARGRACASACPASGRGRRDIERLRRATSTTTSSPRAFRDLGGHDLADLLDAFARADAVTDRPTVVFAYTIKAWRLPTEGHPATTRRC